MSPSPGIGKTMNNQLTIDLRSDCREHFRRELATMGYDIVGNEGDDFLCLYHKMTRRRIAPKQRQVKVSSQFTCPKQYRIGLSNLKRAIAIGDNLHPFMSRQIKKLSSHDRLFDYWWLHHFHLGDTIGQHGFVTRTQHILMALVDEEYVYFISVEDHGAGENPWHKKKLLTVVHDNWPHLIAHARLPVDADVHSDHCDEDIKQLRKARLSIAHDIRDAVYIDPGIGVLGDGIHIEDRRFADRVLRAVDDAQGDVIRDWASIRDGATAQGFFLDANATLSLRGIFLQRKHQVGATFHLDVRYCDVLDAKTGYWFRRYAPRR